MADSWPEAGDAVRGSMAHRKRTIRLLRSAAAADKGPLPATHPHPPLGTGHRPSGREVRGSHPSQAWPPGLTVPHQPFRRDPGGPLCRGAGLSTGVAVILLYDDKAGPAAGGATALWAPGEAVRPLRAGSRTAPHGRCLLKP